MPYDASFMPDWNAPDRLKMLVYEAYDACAATAILNHRSVGRGTVFLAYEMMQDKVMLFYIPRKSLYDAQVKEMFSDPAWQSIRQLTNSYDIRTGFCIVIPDPVDDIFYTLVLTYSDISPVMSSKELQAVIDAYPKQETKGDNFSAN